MEKQAPKVRQSLTSSKRRCEKKRGKTSAKGAKPLTSTKAMKKNKMQNQFHRYLSSYSALYFFLKQSIRLERSSFYDVST
jgi:hypothetical protein